MNAYLKLTGLVFLSINGLHSAAGSDSKEESVRVTNHISKDNYNYKSGNTANTFALTSKFTKTGATPSLVQKFLQGFLYHPVRVPKGSSNQTIHDALQRQSEWASHTVSTALAILPDGSIHQYAPLFSRTWSFGHSAHRIFNNYLTDETKDIAPFFNSDDTHYIQDCNAAAISLWYILTDDMTKPTTEQLKTGILFHSVMHKKFGMPTAGIFGHNSVAISDESGKICRKEGPDASTISAYTTKSGTIQTFNFERFPWLTLTHAGVAFGHDLDEEALHKPNAMSAKELRKHLRTIGYALPGEEHEEIERYGKWAALQLIRRYLHPRTQDYTLSSLAAIDNEIKNIAQSVAAQVAKEEAAPIQTQELSAEEALLAEQLIVNEEE